MYFIPAVILSILLLNTVQAQSNQCSCLCCFGQGCQPTPLLDVIATQCTDAACLSACKERYYQCTASPPYGQAIAKCKSATTTTTTATITNSPITGGPFLCRCECCNTGSYSCSPSFVGDVTAYSCQVGTCSIACANRFPYVCVNNQYGQTQGTCLGQSTPAPIIPSGSLRCGCSCQGSNGYHQYEMITSNGCSSCLSACQSLQIQCNNYQNTYCVS